MPHASLAIQNILQNSNIFIGSRETDLFTPFGSKKVTQFSGLPPTSVSYLKDCLELDVHHMTSLILSILIDFIQDRAFFVPFLLSFYKALNVNNFGTRNDIKKR